MIDAIVAVVTLVALGFAVVWLFVPGFRERVEQPKFDMLRSEHRFRSAGRPPEINC